MAVAKPVRQVITKKTTRIILYAELLLLDVAALVFGPLIGHALVSMMGGVRADFFPNIAVLVLYLVLAIIRGGYSLQSISRSLESVRSAMLSLSLAVFAVLLVVFFVKGEHTISRLNFSVDMVICGLLMAVERVYFPRHALKLSGGALLNELIITHRRPLKVRPGKAMVLDAESAGLRPDLNDPTMLHYFGTIVQAFDRVLIDSQPEDHRSWALMLKGANVDGEILLEEANELGAISMQSFAGCDTLLVARRPLSLANRMKKRLLDLSIAVPLILLLGPLLILVALAVKLDSRGPVFFRQDRVGRGNRLFKVLKFRSMRVEQADALGSRSASRDDDRITRVGRIIRATSIDELPQLLNVLLGDMSLVGPRPHALGSLAGDRLFWQVDDTYWLRHQLKPGITGLAQVRGFRGATAATSDLTDRLQSDMEYIEGWDIWRDIAILANTFRVIVHRNAF